MGFSTPQVAMERNACTMFGPPPALAIDNADALSQARSHLRRHEGLRIAERDGLLLACVDACGTRTRWVDLQPRTMQGWVVGRHDECDLRVLDPRSRASLRHSLLWALHRREGIELRVMDLRAQHTTRIVGAGEIESARVTGPVALRLGNAHVFAAPVASGTPLAEALPAVLPDVTWVSTPHGTRRRTDRSSARPCTLIQPLGSISDVSPAPTGRGASGLTMRCHIVGHEPSELHLSWHQLEAGAFFGRYTRCHSALRGALPLSVSRVHLGLFAYHDHLGDHVAGMDLVSTRGVWVDGELTRCVMLRPEMRVGLGPDVELEVVGVRD